MNIETLPRILVEGLLDGGMLKRVSEQLTRVESELKEGNAKQVIVAVSAYGDSLTSISVACTVMDKIRLFGLMKQVEIIILVYGCLADAGLILLHAAPLKNRVISQYGLLAFNPDNMHGYNLHFFCQCYGTSERDLRTLFAHPNRSTEGDPGMIAKKGPDTRVLTHVELIPQRVIGSLLDESSIAA